jgi:RimJ/RimL family protein N-acetyltransferase
MIEPVELPHGGLSDGTVTVRPYRAADAEQLHEGAQDAEVVRFAGVPWATDTVQQLRERITERWPALAHEGRSLNVSIRDAQTDELLGHLVLFGMSSAASRVEVGFWLRREARGRGAAGRAVELVCTWAFETLGLHRVQASAMVDNAASQRTLEKAGFVREGIPAGTSPRRTAGAPTASCSPGCRATSSRA